VVRRTGGGNPGVKKHFNEKRKAHPQCPPLAGVARRAGGGLVVFGFPSSPCPLQRGTTEEGFLMFWIPAFAGMTILSHGSRGEKTL